jgi:methionyl-tRNA formyltransferase
MVRLYECRLEKTQPAGQPGQVVAVDGETLCIAAPGGMIVAKKARGEGGKVAAAEFAKQASLQIGEQFI